MDAAQARTLSERLTVGWISYLNRRGHGVSPIPTSQTDLGAFNMLVALYIITLSNAPPNPAGSAAPQRSQATRSQGSIRSSGHQLASVIQQMNAEIQKYEDPALQVSTA